MEVAMNYAGFWRRLVAVIIDGVILGAITGVLMAIFGAQQAASWLGSIIGIIYVIGFWTWRGQTPGKMVMGIKIIKTDGSPIGIGRAILRYVGYLVSTIIICIGYLMIAWDSKKQGLHDKIAGTYVVKTS
jgi:uncharacterized RDD family membrane protein YckC